MKNELATAVLQVLEDYPNEYKNLMGEPGDSSFESKIKIKDAEDIYFIQYSKEGRSLVSWQASLITTEDHGLAQKKFRAAYQQLQGLVVKLGPLSYKLRCPYEKPDLEQKFTSLVFDLDPSNSYTEPIKVELQLIFHMPMEWTVAVLVYTRERKDTDPPRQLRSF
jgi:hypothetical protein